MAGPRDVEDTRVCTIILKSGSVGPKNASIVARDKRDKMPDLSRLESLLVIAAIVYLTISP